jgi:hypothetical protein
MNALKFAAKPTLSPARQHLVDVEAELRATQETVAVHGERVARLQGAIDASAMAEAALAQGAADDCGVGLARLAAGEDASAMAALVNRAETARRAADAARRALAPAEQDLKQAVLAVEAVQVKKREAIGAVMIEIGDAIGVKYLAAFAALADVRDELEALAGGLAGVGPNIRMIDIDVEAPKYNLPAFFPRAVAKARLGLFGSAHGLETSKEEGYIPTLRRSLDARKIAAKSSAWRWLAARLASDPSAEFKDTAPEDATPQSGRLLTNRMKADDPMPMLTETPRERVMRILSSHPW